jgi:hypothetical protein
MTIDNLFEKPFQKQHKTNNLLKEIKDNPDNPLNKILKISDDCRSIYSFDRNQKRLIIQENGNVNIEEIARELTAHLGLKEQKGYYEIEKEYGDSKNRADLTGRIGNNICVIIENKVENESVSKDKFKTTIGSAFVQMQKYINYVNDNEVFGTVVIIDVYKILQNPENFEKFSAVKTIEKQEKQYDIFKKFGICIETRHFITSSGEHSPNVVFHFPSISVLSAGGEKIKTGHVLMMATKSSPEGIRNIRNNISISNIKKRTLVKSILSSLLEAYHNNKNKKQFINGSKHKVFVYIAGNTIREKNPLKNVIIVSTEGAMVDGQNSTDAIRIILKAINRVKTEKLTKLNSECLEREIRNTLKKNKIIINLELDSFVSFINSLDFKIEVVETDNRDEAIKIALAQNTSVEVEKSYIEMSNYQEEISAVGNHTLVNLDYILIAPQLDVSTFSKQTLDRSMNYEDFARLYHYSNLAYHGKSTNIKNQLFVWANAMGTNSQKGIVQLITRFIQNEEEFNLSDINVTNTDDKINISKTEERDEIIKLVIYNENDMLEDIKTSNKNLIKIRKQLEILEKEREKFVHFKYAIKNEEEFRKVVTSIFEIRHFATISNNAAKHDHKDRDISDYLTIRCFYKYNSWEISSSDISNEAEDIVAYFDYIKENCEVTPRYMKEKVHFNDGSIVDRGIIVDKLFGTRP